MARQAHVRPLPDDDGKSARKTPDPQAPSKSGFRGWIIVVVAAAGLFGLVVLVGAGTLVYWLVAHQGNPARANMSAANGGGRVETGEAELTSDLDALEKWCTQSESAIERETAANPIRGGELQDKHLKELQGKLMNKQVRWPFKITNISQTTLELATWRPEAWLRVDAKNDGFPSFDKSKVPSLVVHLGTRLNNAGPHWMGENGVRVRSPQKLHSVSIGEFVRVIGNVDDVRILDWTPGSDWHPYYDILVVRPRIEGESSQE